MAHVEAAAEPSGRRRGSGGLVKKHVGIVGGVEDGEEAEQMGGVVDRDTAYADHVVGVVAALYVESGVIFGTGLHAGEHHSIMYGVGIAEDVGHLPHHLHADNALAADRSHEAADLPPAHAEGRKVARQRVLLLCRNHGCGAAQEQNEP